MSIKFPLKTATCRVNSKYLEEEKFFFILFQPWISYFWQIHLDYEAVVKLSDGFNGADLRNVCTEAGKNFYY